MNGSGVPSVPRRTPLATHMPVFKIKYLASPVSIWTFTLKEYVFGSTSSICDGSSSFSKTSRGPTRQPSILTAIKAGGWSCVCSRYLASMWVDRSGAMSCESWPPGWGEIISDVRVFLIKGLLTTTVPLPKRPFQ